MLEVNVDLFLGFELQSNIGNNDNESVNDSWICQARKEKRLKRLRDNKRLSKRTVPLEEEYEIDEDLDNDYYNDHIQNTSKSFLS